MKGVEKLSMVIATNLTSICCVYKNKIFKTTHPKNVASIQVQKVATYD